MGESTTDGSGADEAADGSPPRSRRSPDGAPPSPPWWRRGSVWFVIIVVEVIAVTVISLAFARPPGEVSLAGADVARLCADVSRLRAARAQQLPLTLETASAEFEREAAGYRELVASAPTSVRADLEQLAGLSDELAGLARTLAAQDPSGGPAKLATRQGELSGRSAGAADRVRAAVRQACGIDIDVDPAVPEPGAPTGAPTTAATNPATTTGPETVTSPAPTGTVPTVAGGY
jgi:hypothetical protein